MEITLDKLKPNEKAIIKLITEGGILKKRFFDIGITPGAVVIRGIDAPLGDPIRINVRGYDLSIRKSEARKILVNKIE